MTSSVSALFVRPDGPYPQLVEDWWDEARDARRYDGPNPVVAHPPCKRWSMLARVVQARYPHLRVGDDGGLFELALATVRRWGGVLEHPAESIAWGTYGLPRPRQGTWLASLFRQGEWVTEVCQRNYGHRAEKRTWLLLVGEPQPLNWAPPPPEAWCSTDRPTSEMDCEHMGRRERELTPEPFARLLVELAQGAA